MTTRAKRLLSLVLIFALVLTLTITGKLPINFHKDSPANLTEEVQAASVTDKYGLAKTVEDGVILHCWNWSFQTIINELPNIANAGFTSIQTSPIQMNKDGASGVYNNGDWWKFYQPINFKIGNALGTRDQFKRMCDEAHKYGIKVIVDVVANHLANNTTGANTKAERCYQISSEIRDNEDFWHHDNYSGPSDSDRYQMTHAPVGMPDLNTSNSQLQDMIIAFLNDAQDCGADGFRFDAAKHIETPDDYGFSSNFWSKVSSRTHAKNSNVFLYGEILNTAGPGNYNDVKKYTKYLRVTNNLYGHTVQDSVKDWKASYVTNLHGYNKNGADIFGKDGNEWVLWNESHDTFAGNYQDKTDWLSEEQMTYAWCAVAARYPVALYYARPSGGSDWAKKSMGSHTSTYRDSRIAGMNRFHNFFAGQSEYASNYKNMLVVERGTTGVAIINYDRSSADVTIKMNRMKDGTYKDQISGNTFTVSGGYLKGKLGSKGVAAIYNTDDPVIVISSDSKAYIQKPSGWSSTIYCYVYGSDGYSTTQNAAWPGVKMSYDSNTGYYSYNIPSDIKNPKVMFTDGSRQYPGANQPGLSISGSMIYNKDNNGKWEKYSTVSTGTVKVKYVDESGNTVASEKTLTGAVGSSYTTSAADVSGYDLKSTPSNANGKYTEQTITVKYVYAKKSDSSRKAWIKKPSGWGSTMYCYVYGSSNKQNASWPGVKMTYDSSTGYYYYKVPSDIQNAKVIFTDGSRQVPGAMQPGFDFTSNSMIYNNGSWYNY